MEQKTDEPEMDPETGEPIVKMMPVGDGKLPQRMSSGAIGFDAYLRAIVDPEEVDPDKPYIRKTLFNFTEFPKDEHVKQYHRFNYESQKHEYLLLPGKNIVIGLGYIAQVPFPYYHEAEPRSGLAVKYGIEIGGARIVDPDYRGEPGAILKNTSDEPFWLSKYMRVAQIVFKKGPMPVLCEVKHYYNFSETSRGSRGSGSTGTGVIDSEPHF